LNEKYSLYIDDVCRENDIDPHDPPGSNDFFREVSTELQLVAQAPYSNLSPSELDDYIRCYEFQNLNFGKGWYAAYRIYEEENEILVFAVAHGRSNLFNLVINRFYRTDRLD